MPEVHAILSASSSKRWLNCTPSARLEQNFPNESSVYAEEGTAAHALGEYKLRKYLHERVQRPTSEFDSEEMEGNTDIYAEFIINQIERICHMRRACTSRRKRKQRTSVPGQSGSDTTELWLR